MSDWLAKNPHAAQWIWTSDAARAQSTATFVASGFSVADEQIVKAHDLYHASPESIIEVLRGTPADVSSVAVVAHNPGITYLVNMLAGRRVTVNVPTFGVARFDVTGGWPDLSPAATELEIFESPKTIVS